MKTFKQQMEETREAVSQITCWCLTVAAHQEFGIGSVRQDRLIEWINQLEEINIHTMMQKGTRAADREREGWLRGFAPMEFTVPMLRAPRGRVALLVEGVGRNIPVPRHQLGDIRRPPRGGRG